MVDGEPPLMAFEGRLEECVLLVKHPLNETIHPWWAYGAFLELDAEMGPEFSEGAPLHDEKGKLTGYTHSLLKFVSNVFENVLWHNGDCLLIGVCGMFDFPSGTDIPTELFQTIPSTEDWA
jgi:hypothetical protein